MNKNKNENEKRENFIDLNYKLRDLAKDKYFRYTSISSRECLEDTYRQHLYRTGLAKKLRYRLILWLIYKR